MGFPQVDKFLVKRFLDEFILLQTDPAETVNDIFEEMEPTDRDEICKYLSATKFTGDLQERPEGVRCCYVIPHWPVAEVGFPQIGISLGDESQADKFLGDYTGTSTPVLDRNTGETVAWKIPKGYLAQDNLMIDIACSTKDEAIWLAALCKMFILKALPDLTQLGAMEVSIGISDVKINPDAMLQPMAVFARTIRFSAKVANTWNKKIPVYTYEEGVNTALVSFYQEGVNTAVEEAT